jgi:aryl-alcohol dehydrogenase-like predicted oxidoreductase
MFLFHSSRFFSAGENFYKNLDIVDRIKALADKKGVTPGQLSIAWVAAQGTIPIPGTKQVGRLEENWGARDVDLNAEELAEMRAVIDAAKPVGNRCAVVFLFLADFGRADATSRYNEAAQAAVGH